ncbi:unnamed protein product [Fusarium fujikuroi]|nr:unnamed protein product [Fusarium fujikuroi]
MDSTLGGITLQAASAGGYMQARANTNAAARSKKRTALQAASAGSYIQVIKRLLEARANTNTAPAKYSWIAL